MTHLLRTDPRARTAAPAGMRDQVMRAGLRRRFAFAGAGSTALVAAVAAAALVTGTSQTDSLRIEQPARPGVSPTAVGAEALAAPGDDAAAGGQVTAPGAPRSVAQAPMAAPAPAPSGGSSAAPSSGHGTHAPVTRRDREFGQVCQGQYTGVGTDGRVTAGDWCVSVAPPAARDTAPYPKLTFTVCRSSVKDGGSLTFRTAQEVEFVISSTRTKKALWTWSTGQHFRATRHTLSMGNSQCSDWETRWDWRDDRGTPLAAGQRLTLTAWSTSSELVHEPAAVEFTA